mmetsp:Transcript_11256/g.22647  ORF Transcript_11256/g.22647 Transcript_11256/m.22647 type:complete len:110 (+) Transcript_11256:4656-4985(+)
MEEKDLELVPLPEKLCPWNHGRGLLPTGVASMLPRTQMRNKHVALMGQLSIERIRDAALCRTGLRSIDIGGSHLVLVVCSLDGRGSFALVGAVLGITLRRRPITSLRAT